MFVSKCRYFRLIRDPLELIDNNVQFVWKYLSELQFDKRSSIVDCQQCIQFVWECLSVV